MKKSVKAFLDNNIFDVSILEPEKMFGVHKLLKEDAESIKTIFRLNNVGIIEFYIGPNILVEDLGRTLEKIQKINKKWDGFISKCKILASKNSFILASYNKQHGKFKDPNERYKENDRFLQLKKILKDKGKDSANILEAESKNIDYFVTVDYKLINKARNEGRKILKIKLLRPTELLKEIYRS